MDCLRAWAASSLLGWACGANSTVAGQDADTSSVLALVGGSIYASPDAVPVTDGVLLVRGGKIAEVGRRGIVEIPPTAAVLDCTQSAVIAGFWNSHVHFTEPHWSGADSLPADTLTHHLRQMLTRYGFVQVTDIGSWLNNTLALRLRIESGEIPGPGIMTTGPGFVPSQGSPFYILPDRLPELTTPVQARAAIRNRLDEGADAIKLFTASVASPSKVVPMPVDLVRAATAEAHRRGRLVFAHPTNNEGVRAALEGGVDIIAHTTPDGGPWKAGTAERMHRAHLALIPTLKLWKFELQKRGQDSITIANFLTVATRQLRDYAEAGGQVLFGTDVGYMTDSDPSDEYFLMQQGGMSFRQILAALTTAPADRFKKPGWRGRLEVGTTADITVVDGDPAKNIGALAAVRYTLRGGRLIYSRR